MMTDSNYELKVVSFAEFTPTPGNFSHPAPTTHQNSSNSIDDFELPDPPTPSPTRSPTPSPTSAPTPPVATPATGISPVTIGLIVGILLAAIILIAIIAVLILRRKKDVPTAKPIRATLIHADHPYAHVGGGASVRSLFEQAGLPKPPEVGRSGKNQFHVD
jgi:hypothetical protein